MFKVMIYTDETERWSHYLLCENEGEANDLAHHVGTKFQADTLVIPADDFLSNEELNHLYMMRATGLDEFFDEMCR